MSEEATEPADVRAHEFAADGPIVLDLGLGTGVIDIRLIEQQDHQQVTVELRHDPSAGSPWSQGLTSALDWIGHQFGDQWSADLRNVVGEAIAQTRIDMLGERLVLRTPKPLPLRHVPLAATVTAPAGSRLEIKTGSARVTASGTSGSVDVSTAAGDVALERADGAVAVRTGGGGVTLGPASAGLHVRTGGGTVRVADASGSATVITGTGSVRIGAVDGGLVVRSGSGAVTIAEAGAGSVDVKTGTGEITIGIRAGTLAEIDLSSGSGTVASDLTVSENAPDGDVGLRVRARSGSGNATVTSAH